MFKKKPSPSITTSSNEDRRSVTTSLRTPPGQHRRQVEPRRQPDSQIGIARLLEAYDDYPRVVEDLETVTSKLQIAEEQAAIADAQREETEQELIKEREERKAEVIEAREEKARAEKEREKKIRGELEPRITDLSTKLKDVTADRDRLNKELTERRTEMAKWITAMEKIQKERALIQEREAKAIEDRKKVDEQLKELDLSVLTGLREASKPPGEKAEAKVEKEKVAEKPVEKTSTTSSTPFGGK